MAIVVLAPGSVGQPYAADLNVDNASQPCTFAVTAGTVPPGLQVPVGSPSVGGEIQGVPSAAGNYTFEVSVQDHDGSGNTIGGGSTIYSIVITGPAVPPLSITTTSLPDGVVGIAYNQSLAATGGTTPYSFSITVGLLPAVITLTAATGALQGIPAFAGIYTFTATVTDAQGQTSSKILSITIAPATAPVRSTHTPLAASGGCAPVILIDVLTASGKDYHWSEHTAIWDTIVPGESAQYLNWVVGAPKFSLYGSTQTDTANFSVQNISGNTVERDAAKAFSKVEFIGAYVVCRIWRGDSEDALFTFTGNVNNVDIDEGQMDLTLEGFGNFSTITAPAFNIDVTCPLTFGSMACGSTSPVPCDQSYGGCLSINRFAGVVTQWDTECPNVQFAQPAPAVFYNPGRAF